MWVHIFYANSISASVSSFFCHYITVTMLWFWVNNSLPTVMWSCLTGTETFTVIPRTQTPSRQTNTMSAVSSLTDAGLSLNLPINHECWQRVTDTHTHRHTHAQTRFQGFCSSLLCESWFHLCSGFRQEAVMEWHLQFPSGCLRRAEPFVASLVHCCW